jgi:hypothetical protein
MVRPPGFEPGTTRLEGGCSIQLSYERKRRSMHTSSWEEINLLANPEPGHDADAE